MIVAGLSQAEALAFWATEIVDKKIGQSDLNHYLMNDDFELNEVSRLADALETSNEVVYMARKNAKEKLEEIDPLLPDRLIERQDGWPLPDAMWTRNELDLLNTYRHYEGR